MIRRFFFKLYRLLKIMTSSLDGIVYNVPTQHKKNYGYLIERVINTGITSAVNFEFESIKAQTLNFVKSMQTSDSVSHYKFAASQHKENVYSSAYACLIYDMYGEISKLSDIQKQEWVCYFDSFQSQDDGLWYDENLRNEYYDDTDWWGARHLAIHMIAAYTALNAKPKYKILYVEKYYNKDFLYTWLDSFNWDGFFDPNNDIDNKIMNIVVAMQYNRDFLDDKEASVAILNLYDYLDSKINPVTGMWGKFDINNPDELSRIVQFTYHLLMPYFYDNRNVLYKEKILEYVFKTQNKLGGYGVKLNSSACEDIDSIDLLAHLTDRTNPSVQKSLKKAFVWVLSNQNDDGGFVFRQNEQMWYGHHHMTANTNESHMFATWFRTLAILKITAYLDLQNCYNYTKISGY